MVFSSFTISAKDAPPFSLTLVFRYLGADLERGCFLTLIDTLDFLFAFSLTSAILTFRKFKSCENTFGFFFDKLFDYFILFILTGAGFSFSLFGYSLSGPQALFGPFRGDHRTISFFFLNHSIFDHTKIFTCV